MLHGADCDFGSQTTLTHILLSIASAVRVRYRSFVVCFEASCRSLLLNACSRSCNILKCLARPQQ